MAAAYDRALRYLLGRINYERNPGLADRDAFLADLPSKLAAQQTPRGMVLTLSGVLFDTGKATLKPGAAPSLDRVASYTRSIPSSVP